MPPGDHPVFRPAPTVRRYALDADTILFERAARRIFVLNETAAFVWQSLEQGLDANEAAGRLARQTGADPNRVLADCLALLEQWTEAGLGGDDSASGRAVDIERSSDAQEAASGPIGPSADSDDGDTGRADEPPLARGEAVAHGEALARGEAEAEADADADADDPNTTERRYRIADLRLRLRAGAEAFGLIEGLIDHCALPDEGTGDDGHGDRDRDGRGDGHRDGDTDRDGDEWATLSITRDAGEWALWLKELRLIGCDSDEKLAPMVHGTLMHLGYAASRSRLAIHGAAVYSDERCVLLPGQPGAGKSTLTAALITAGCGYCCDDLTLLDGDPLRLRGVPLCLGLKTGSWPLLGGSIPALEALPIRLREDGQQVKYLPPPAGRTAPPDDDFRVTALVFPRIVPDAPCLLEPMARSAALLRIADSGYHLMGRLDTDTVEAMLEWLASLDCYELSYSALDEAVAAVAGVLDPGRPGMLDPAP